MKADVYIETSISWSKVSDGVVGIAITIDNPENAKTLFGKVTQCLRVQQCFMDLKMPWTV